MKNTTILLLLFIATTTISSKCKKDDDQPAQLPPETTIGANTFGCKINGEVFVPKDGRGKPGLFCQYVYLGNGLGGGWFLNIPATNWQPNPPIGVNIETDSLLIIEGQTYRFKNSKGFPRAFFDNGNIYATLITDTGSLHITKHDQIRRILSGTFFFTGTNTSTSSGEKISVTEGRFDITY